MLKERINEEIYQATSAELAGDLATAFNHLERAHVLGQASTYQHTRIHWRMFKLGLKMRSVREVWGQIIRMIGAATKTPFGIYPTGNTGGANVWFFKRMPITEDLRKIMENSKL
jgi:hypothetical protein